MYVVAPKRAVLCCFASKKLLLLIVGSFVPSAAMPRVTVKLRFSAPQDFTGTVRFPLNSNERVDGSSKRIGVSSILKIRDKG